MAKFTVNMRSHADSVQGHGVLSAYWEQVELVREGLSDRFEITENGSMLGDITHYHTVNLRYFLTLPLAKLRGMTVGYVHFLPETVDESLRMPWIARTVFYKYLISFYKSMDYLVTVNPLFIEKLMAYGIAREKILYIPNFVSDELFYPLKTEEKKELRKACGLDPDRFTVVCAGQLQTRKGVLDFADLARKMPEMQFVWAGGFSFGGMTDGYREIKELLENPPTNLSFPGILAREQMNGFYNMGDVMFLPSYGELFPMTILEAMSCGVPVLLRDIDVYPQILADYYMKGNSQQEFQTLLEQLRDDSAFYAIACDGAQRGHQFYNRKHVLHMWDAFYSRIVLCAKPSFRQVWQRIAPRKTLV